MLYDFVVVGGGIIGLATARELLYRFPRTKLVLIEKEGTLASHQSSHNSGVIHSGIYYKKDSLKAKLCREGREAIWAYCKKRSIPFKTVGKLIVALTADEVQRLGDLYQRGMENGVPGLILVEGKDIKEYEPYCNGLKAIYSPSTGIVDWKRVCLEFAQDAKRSGAELVTSAEVTSIEKRSGSFIVSTPNNEYESRMVITCGGLYSDRLAQMTNGSPHPKIIPFRGDYLLLKKEKCHLIKGNIYPVPDPRLPFLGVHFTPTMDGRVLLGPSVVLAFAREGYAFDQLNMGELIETLTYPGFVKLALKYWKTGVTELYRDVVMDAYLKNLRKYIPEIEPGDCLPGPAGVRAQAVSPDGTMVDDFQLDYDDGIMHVRNAPSPAATSSLAIAKYIADALPVNTKMLRT
jgi:L-2-hydroxyglutarate oxidase LhgO